MRKIVIIINGKGGVGKDTLCGLASKYFGVENISAITPVKTLAQQCGWKGEKDAKSRRFLSDLKRLLIEYNDLPTKYLYSQYQKFLAGKEEILFVHIREKDEIEKFRKLVGVKCVTLLVERKMEDIEQWGNSSDDEVEDYSYDYIFRNEKMLSETEQEFTVFLRKLLENGNKTGLITEAEKG